MKKFSNRRQATRLKELCRHFLLLGLALSIGALPAASRRQRFLSHFYYVNDPSSLNSLQANAGSIGLVSPQWFAAGRTGQLASSIDASVVDWAKRRHLRIMPLLINDKFDPQAAHAALADEQTQSALIEQILQAASANHFYGVELDFEHMAPGDRDAYSRLAENLGKALHRRRMKLSVALPAPLAPAPLAEPSAGSAAEPWVQNQQALAFDYRALGAVADFITLMTYDEYNSPDRPGPIAGLPWVEACLRRTLDSISPQKVLLGIPLYYRQWTGKTISEGPYEEAMRLATDRGAKFEMDPEQREKVLRFDDGQNSRVVWLHDAASLEERLELVKKYNLAGFSAWRLGQEDPAAWPRAFSRFTHKGR